MRASEVVSRLGPPDVIRVGDVVLTSLEGRDVVRVHDIDSDSQYANVSEIWYYGVHGVDSFPTLGRVYLADDPTESNQRRIVHRVFGNGRPSRKLVNIPEAKLRHIIATLGAENECSALAYHPGRMIIAVNALVPLGKELSLAVIEEYLRVCPHTHGSVAEKVLLLLRVLFDVPQEAGHMPDIKLGKLTPSAPADARLLPRYPIYIAGDIPLLLVQGYTYEGPPRSVEPDLQFFREYGALRRDKLTPLDNPFRVLDQLERSSTWTYTMRTNEDRALLLCQLLALMDSVWRFEDAQSRARFSQRVASPGQWERFLSSNSHWSIQWNRDGQEYRLGPAR